MLRQINEVTILPMLLKYFQLKFSTKCDSPALAQKIKIWPTHDEPHITEQLNIHALKRHQFVINYSQAHTFNPVWVLLSTLSILIHSYEFTQKHQTYKSRGYSIF